MSRTAPGFLIIRAAALDANRFRRRDLHVVHIAPVPQRLEDPIAEAERQDILHCFLAQIMIDPINVRFCEDSMDALVQFARAVQIVAETVFRPRCAASLARGCGPIPRRPNRSATSP